MKKIITIICMVLSIITYGQVTVSIEDIEVNDISISSNSSIDMGTNASVKVKFRVDLSKSSYLIIGNSNVWISVYKSTGERTDHYITSVPQSHFQSSVSKDYEFDIYAQEIDFLGGGYLSATLKQTEQPGAEWESSHISIIKTPTFNISPSSANIVCGDTSARTFSVTDVYNTSGTKTYKWQVGNSWLYNGSPAPNEITTNSNSITLIPNSYPPNNVKAATIFNGTQLPYSTSTITLTPIENRTIIGDFTVCSSETLSINNLNANETVTWSSSNTSLASITSSNNQVTVYANGNGQAIITATITDTCGQQLVLTTPIIIGVPTDYYDANIDVHPYPANQGGIFLENWTRVWMTNYPGSPGSGNSWNWTANYSMIMNANSPQASIKPLSLGYMTIKVRKSNKCGNGSWVSKNFYITELPGGGHDFEEN